MTMDSDTDSTTPSVDNQKVTAVIAVIDNAIEDLASGHEQSSRRRNNSKYLFTQKIKVLLDSGSDGDIWFHSKGTTKRFPYSERQMVKSYHTSNGNFQTKGQAKFEMKFFDFSDSKHYRITPDVLEYDEKSMLKSQRLTLFLVSKPWKS